MLSYLNLSFLIIIITIIIWKPRSYLKTSYILKSETSHVYSDISHVWHVRHQSHIQDRHFWHRSCHVPSDLPSARDAWDILGNNRPITLATAFWNLDQTRQVLLLRAHHDLELAAPKLEDAPGLSNGVSPTLRRSYFENSIIANIEFTRFWGN